MTDALVVADHRRGHVRPTTYEAITAGADLSPDTLRVAVIGGNAETLESSLNREVVDAIHVVPGAAEFHHTQHRQGVQRLLDRIDEPTHVVVPHTDSGVDYAPALAVALDRPIVTDISGIVETDPLRVRRRWYASKLEVTVDLEEGPAVLTVGPGVWPTASGTGDPMVQREAITIPTDRTVTVNGFEERRRQDPAVGRATTWVVVGGGIEEPETIELAERVAALTDGVVVGTRPAVDAGWVSRDRWVDEAEGSPTVGIAVGVNGDRGGRAGIRRAKAVIAVNSDPGAPIFEVADQAIVSDPTAVLAALEDRLITRRETG